MLAAERQLLHLVRLIEENTDEISFDCIADACRFRGCAAGTSESWGAIVAESCSRSCANYSQDSSRYTPANKARGPVDYCAGTA